MFTVRHLQPVLSVVVSSCEIAGPQRRSPQCLISWTIQNVSGILYNKTCYCCVDHTSAAVYCSHRPTMGSQTDQRFLKHKEVKYDL